MTDFDTDPDIDNLRNAIAQLAGPGATVTAFVVTAHTTDPDGKHAVHSITDADQLYQVLGLLEHGKEIARARFHGWDDDDE